MARSPPRGRSRPTGSAGRFPVQVRTPRSTTEPSQSSSGPSKAAAHPASMVQGTKGDAVTPARQGMDMPVR